MHESRLELELVSRRRHKWLESVRVNLESKIVLSAANVHNPAQHTNLSDCLVPAECHLRRKSLLLRANCWGTRCSEKCREGRALVVPSRWICSTDPPVSTNHATNSRILSWYIADKLWCNWASRTRIIAFRLNPLPICKKGRPLLFCSGKLPLTISRWICKMR